ARFGRFLGRDARLRSDGAREWTFERGTLVVTDAAGGERLTGALVPALPCIAAYALTVADLAATRRHLDARRVRTRLVGSALVVDGGAEIGSLIAFVGEGAAAPWLG
ncbi:MAG: hypothetical protein IT561_21705, partial [Alphaproteobacteria bacterium]|nr:hypothetical protein [Alphaproteobacteria bacterium]